MINSAELPGNPGNLEHTTQKILKLSVKLLIALVPLRLCYHLPTLGGKKKKSNVLTAIGKHLSDGGGSVSNYFTIVLERIRGE